MSFKNSCKTGIVNSEAPQAIKDTVSAFIDKLDELYRENGNAEGFKKAAQQMLNDELMAVKGARYEALRDMAKAANNKRRIAEFVTTLKTTKEDGVAKALKSLFFGADNAIDGGNISIESRRRSIKGQLQSHFRNLAELKSGDSNLREVFLKGAIDKEITQELFELESGRGGGITGNKDALLIAKELSKFNETELKIKQDAGIAVSKRKAFVTNLSYERDKIKDAFSNSKEFANFMLQHIDEAESFAGSKNDILENLSGMYEDILNGKNLAYKEVIDPKFQETISFNLNKHTRLANRFKRSRQLVFKSGESMFEVMKKVGTESLNESFVRRMDTTGNAASLISIFGTNPELAFDNLKKHVIKEYGEDSWKKAEGVTKRMTGLMEYAKGSTPADGILNTIQTGVMSFEVATKLGSAVLQSVSDLPFAVAALKGFNGAGLTEGYQKMMSMFSKLAFKEGDRVKIGKLLDIYTDVEMGQMRSDLTSNTVKPGFMARAAESVMAITGFNWQADTSRKSVAAVFASEMADHLSGNFDELSPQVKKNLSRYGIDQTAFNLFKGGVDDVTLSSGSTYKMLTVEKLNEHIDAIPDAQIKEMMDLKGKKGGVNKFKTDLVNSYRDYLNDYTSIASPNPGIRQKALLRLGTDPNTAQGVAVNMMMLFKSFGLTAVNVLERNVLSQAGTQDLPLKKALKTGDGISAAAAMISQLTAFGMLSTMARDLTKGQRREFTPNAMKTLAVESMMTGGLGIFGDAMFSMLEREDTTGFVLGPIYSDLRDIADTSRRVVKDVLPEDWGGTKHGNISTATSKALTLAIKKSPNLLYGVNALKAKLIENVQESLDPKYRRRYEARMDKINEERGIVPLMGGGTDKELEDIIKALGE